MRTHAVRAHSRKGNMIGKLFFRMLPVQILILAMGAVNSIVDGAMAGTYIDASTVGVIGLYFSMINVFNAVGSVLLGGTTVLCGRFMGRGELEKTEGVFSLNLTVTFLIGAALTLVNILLPGPIATLLGANEALKGSLMQYIVGYSIGILPMLLAQQIASFLQLERQNARGYAGIAGMIVSNVVLDILFVAVLKKGVLGLALATSFSNIIYFLILAPYYLTAKAQLHYRKKNILWGLFPDMMKIGVPGALLVFCLAIRGIVINRILLKYAGNDGLSAMSAFNMICGLFIAYCLGNGSVVRVLISVFAGEEDKEAMQKVLRTVFTKGLALSCGVAAVILALSPLLTSIFFPDRSSHVYHLAYQLFVIYSFCIPLILICQIFTNYLQATGHNLFVNIQSVFDGFLAMVIPAALLAPVMGALGVWIANPIGIVLTILTVPVYCILYWKRLPKNVDEMMFLKPSFDARPENRLSIYIHNMEEVSQTSERIQSFCKAHDLGGKTSYYAALCAEEMAGNVVRHGFSHDKKEHELNVRVINRDDDIMIRLKDDCIPFDPKKIAEMVNDENSYDNIGIRMVYQIADEVFYQNLLGLNALTITIKEENFVVSDKVDFLLEKALRKKEPDLHRRFRDTALVCRNILSRFKLLFPDFTDHSELHSMTVIDACNQLIGQKQIEKLNADEIYILLVAAYLHDVGMGIGESEYQEFKDRLGEKEYFEEHPTASRADFVRDHHNEFSALFIEKYADLFDIPSPEHVFAIKQVARGHRKVDLFDENAYPSRYVLPNGNAICLPYLAVLLRIADEIDVVATRNPILLYDMGALTREIDIRETKKLKAIKEMRLSRETFRLYAETEEESVRESLVEMVAKMQDTLDLCRQVVAERTDYAITQEKILLIYR